MEQTRSDERAQTDPVDVFEKQWREWGQRPLMTSPEEAARRVVQRVGHARTLRPWRWMAGAAAAAAMVIAAVGVVREDLPREGLVSSVVASDRSLEQGVVVMWIDEQTPLYMTFQDPGSTASLGGES